MIEGNLSRIRAVEMTFLRMAVNVDVEEYGRVKLEIMVMEKRALGLNQGVAECIIKNTLR